MLDVVTCSTAVVLFLFIRCCGVTFRQLISACVHVFIFIRIINCVTAPGDEQIFLLGAPYYRVVFCILHYWHLIGLLIPDSVYLFSFV